jgi:hypothetical protein
MATASTAEATKTSAVAPVEHADAAVVRHHHDISVGTDTNGTVQLTHTDEGVEVEGRRQHLYAVVVAVSDKHEAVGCYPHLRGMIELQRPVASTADDSQPQAVDETELVDGVRATVIIRHEQHRAVNTHRHAVAASPKTMRRD